MKFVGKLVEILNNVSNSNLISWNQTGTSFIVKDSETFSQVILPKCKLFEKKDNKLNN